MDKDRNKTGGRQPGVTNKTTGKLKSMISDFLHDNWHQLEKDFKSKKLHPRDRLAFIEKLLKFAVPAMASTNATVELKKQLEALSDQDLEKVVGMVIQQSAAEPEESEEDED